MKYIHVYVLFLMLVFCTSCEGQNQTNPSKYNIRSEAKDTVSSDWPDNNIAHKIKRGNNGTILIASDSGVFRYDGKSFTNLTSKMGSHRFWDVLEDRHGNTWFGSDAGVYYYKGKSFQHFATREGFVNDSVRCIYEDKAGIIWFGTQGGISRYDGKSFRNFTIKGGRWNNVITRIMEDKTGKLWISARMDVSIYDGKKFTPLTNKGGKAIVDVWSIIEDKKGNIWLGGYDGLLRYDGKTFTYFTHNNFVQSIIEDEKGNIWTIGAVGPVRSIWALSRYDQKSLYNKNPTVTEIISGEPAFLGLLEANDGSIWFGYAGGVYRYDGKTITDFKNTEVKNNVYSTPSY
jgi:ligand-binding sensor domain-containing protein